MKTIKYFTISFLVLIFATYRVETFACDNNISVSATTKESTCQSNGSIDVTLTGDLTGWKNIRYHVTGPVNVPNSPDACITGLLPGTYSVMVTADCEDGLSTLLKDIGGIIVTGNYQVISASLSTTSRKSYIGCSTGIIDLVVNGGNEANYDFRITSAPAGVSNGPVTFTKTGTNIFTLDGLYPAGDYTILVADNCYNAPTNLAFVGISSFPNYNDDPIQFTGVTGSCSSVNWSLGTVSSMMNTDHYRYYRDNMYEVGLGLPGSNTPFTWLNWNPHASLTVSLNGNEYKDFYETYSLKTFIRVKGSACADSTFTNLRKPEIYTNVKTNYGCDSYTMSWTPDVYGMWCYPLKFTITEGGLPVWTETINSRQEVTSGVLEYGHNYVLTAQDASYTILTGKMPNSNDPVFNMNRNPVFPPRELLPGCTKYNVPYKIPSASDNCKVSVEVFDASSAKIYENVNISSEAIYSVDNLDYNVDYTFKVIYHNSSMPDYTVIISQNTTNYPTSYQFRISEIDDCQQNGGAFVIINQSSGKTWPIGTKFTITGPAWYTTQTYEYDGDPNNTPVYFFPKTYLPEGNYTMNIDHGCGSTPININLYLSEIGYSYSSFSLNTQPLCGGLKVSPVSDLKFYGGSTQAWYRITDGPPGYDKTTRTDGGSFVVLLPGEYKIGIMTLDDEAFCVLEEKNVIVPDVLPLDFDSIMAYTCTTGTPGHIKIRAKDGVMPYKYELYHMTTTNKIAEFEGDGAAYFTGGVEGEKYFVKLTDDCNNVGIWTDTITITDISKDKIAHARAIKNQVCQFGTVELFGIALGNTTFNWTGPKSWTSTGQFPVIPNADTTMTGNYILTVQPEYCVTPRIDTVKLEIKALPELPVYQSSFSICQGDPDISLETLADVQTTDNSYSLKWYDEDLNEISTPIINTSVLETKTYYVSQVVNEVGCEGNRLAITVAIGQRPDVIVAASVVPLGTQCEGSTFHITIKKEGLATRTYLRLYDNGGTLISFSMVADGSNDLNLTVLVAPSTSTSYYIETVNDTTGCSSATRLELPVTISSRPVLTPGEKAFEHPKCHGETNGSITVTSSLFDSCSIDNGITYIGENPADEFKFENLAAGTYVIRVKNSDGCVSVASSVDTVILIDPSEIKFIKPDKTDITCRGDETGVITFPTPTGGSGSSWLYSIDDGDSWESGNVFTGLAAGTYKVRVMNNNNCESSDRYTLTLTEPTSKPTLNNVFPFPSSCNGNNEGVIVVQVPKNGAPGTTWSNWLYTINDGISWETGGSGGKSYFPLAPGTYQIKVKDINGCISDPAEYTVTEPAPVSINFTDSVQITHVTCKDGNNGKIVMRTPQGGSGTGWEYSINGGGAFSTSGIFENLTAGSRNIKIRDGNGCSFDTVIIITEPDSVRFNITDTTNVSCKDGSDGKITIDAPTGGSETGWEYSLNGGAWTLPLPSVFDDLTAGTHTLQIKDSKGCLSEIKTPLITEPDSVRFAVTPILVDSVSCKSGNNGRIRIPKPTGGSETGWQYSKDNGLNWQTDSIFRDLPAGNYTVQIRDSKECLSATGIVTVYEPDSVRFNASLIDIDSVSCNGYNDGSITIPTPTGGSGGWEYSKDNGASWQTSPVFAGLVAGNYTLQVKDRKGCLSETKPVTVHEPAPITINFTDSVLITHVTCKDDDNGKIVLLTPEGGNGGWEYSINNGGNYYPSGVFENLPAGNYSIKIKDREGCTSQTAAYDITLTEPDSVRFDITEIKNVSCKGYTTGQIEISTPEGGTGHTWEYSLNGVWYTAPIIAGLPAGTYAVQVRDSVGCLSEIRPVIVTEPDSVRVDLSQATVTPVSCKNGSDGTITVPLPTGGSESGWEYRIKIGGSWQIWKDTNVFTGLPAGKYPIQVKDGKDCLSADIDSVEITEPDSIRFDNNITIINVKCHNDSNGKIELPAISGGSGGYQYGLYRLNDTLWQSTATFDNLPAGTYDVQVKDSKGCLSEIRTLTVTQPEPITINLSDSVQISNVTCKSGADGKIVLLTPEGGNGGPWKYSNDNGDTYSDSGVFDNLTAGVYPVIIKDAAGCVSLTLAHDIPVTEPDSVRFAAVTVKNVKCKNGSDGIITVPEPTGGSESGWEYSLDGGTVWQESEIFAGLSAGTYAVRVKDGNGCLSEIRNIIVAEPDSVRFNTVKVDVTCYGGNDGQITVVTPTGGSESGWEYSLDGAWQGTPVFGSLPAGKYGVQVKDGNGCLSKIDSIVITQPEPVLLSTDLSSPLACPNSPATVIISNSLNGVKYTVYNTPSGGTALGSADGNGGTLTISADVMTKSGLLYVETYIEATNCTSVVRVPVWVEIRKTILNYPDIRISACFANTTVLDLSKYIDTLDLVSVTWESTNNKVPIFDVSKINVSDLKGFGKFTYTVTNNCVSSSGILYLTELRREFKWKNDTIVVCYDRADALHLTQIFGIDAEGTFSYINDVPLTPLYLQESSMGGIIFNGKAAYLDNVLYETAYDGKPAKYIRFTYTTGLDSCFEGKAFSLVIVLTEDLL